MENQRTLKELVRKALTTPSTIHRIGEIKDINELKMLADAQKNICVLYTTMTTDMNKFNKILDESITIRDKEVEENIIKKARSVSRRSIVHMIPPNYFDPTVKVFFCDPHDEKFDKKYFKEKIK